MVRIMLVLHGGGVFHRGVLGLLFLILLSGCTVGPDYRRTQPVVPVQWGEEPDGGVTTGPLEVIRWWTLFHDEKLNSYVDRAVVSNKDLQLADSRIRQARAQRMIVSSQAFPEVDVSGAYTRSRRSQNIPSGTPQQQAAGTGGGSGGQNLFQAGFDAGWEIDVFGGVRRAVEAATADIQAAEENRRDTLVTLLSEVARNYIELRGNQQRIAIAVSNINIQRDTLELTRGRFNAGLGNSLEVAQAEALLATTEAKIPTLETSVKQAIHRLGVLLGLRPEALLDELSTIAPIPPVPPEVPIGLPSELLRRRPDVRGAERRLAAATARIGVAVADLFPRFSLTGGLGLQSSRFPNLGSGDSLYYSFASILNWPVFDAGRIRANIEVQNSLQEQALFTYENTVLRSFEDVENAIVAYIKEQATFQSLSRSVDASRRAVDIARELYKRGLVDFLNVLQSEGSLYQVEDQLVQSRQRVSTSLVALFKALGGGWNILPNRESETEEEFPPGQSVNTGTLTK